MMHKWIETILLLTLFFSDKLNGETVDTNAERESLYWAKRDAEQAVYEQYRPYVTEIECSFAEQMRKELDLRWTGTRRRMHDKVEELGMQFVAPHRATIPEARSLQLFVMDKFIQTIHAHEKIRPFLEDFPFNQHISISIGYEGVNGRYCDGSVNSVLSVPGVATNENANKIFYHADDPFTSLFIDLHSESYEEAVKLQAASPVNPGVHEVTDKEIQMDLLLASLSKELWKKYGFVRRAIGGKLANDIEEIGARFDIFRPASRDEARQLIVKATETLLQAINSNEKLKPYLKEDPFPSSRVKMRLRFTGGNFITFHNGSMESVSIDQNKLTYLQDVSWKELNKGDEDLYETVVLATEPYEEALKLVETVPGVLQKFHPPTFFEKLYAWCQNMLMYLLSFFVL